MKTRAALLWEAPGRWQVAEVDLDPPRADEVLVRLGATGLTFFDDDATRFFSPHAAGMSAIFLMAVGKSAKRQ